MEGEPFDPDAAKKLIRRIIAEGRVSFSGHGLKEMENDQLTTVDCVNVLRGGVVEPAEWEKES